MSSARDENACTYSILSERHVFDIQDIFFPRMAS